MAFVDGKLYYRSPSVAPAAALILDPETLHV